jgi:uncharacterized phiE125 gp8 family phage protein
MPLRLVTGPTVEPVTIPLLESHLRADLTAESMLVNAFIGAIREKAENITRRSLITQTWELSFDRFPVPICDGNLRLNERNLPLHTWGEIFLPRSPVRTITGITYLDVFGTLQTVDPSNYQLDTASEPAELNVAWDQSWPAVLGSKNCIKVTYTAGYGDTAADVPDSIIAWMLMNIASLYEHRESVVVDSRVAMLELTTICDSLLTPYIIPYWVA